MIGQGDLTIPNILTMGRLILVPAFVMAYVRGLMGLALLSFFVAGLTDGLDGFLARILKQRTKIGAILDPIADKLLLGASFVCLAWDGQVPSWLTILVVARDVFIIGGMGVLAFYGVKFKETIQPVVVSKLNTLAQMLLVLLVLMDRGLGMGLGTKAAADWLVPVVAVLTALSGAMYVARGFALLSEEN